MHTNPKALLLGSQRACIAAGGTKGRGSAAKNASSVAAASWAVAPSGTCDVQDAWVNEHMHYMQTYDG